MCYIIYNLLYIDLFILLFVVCFCFSICSQVLNFHSLRKTADLNKASRIKNILIFVVYKNKILINILIQNYKIWSIQLYRDYVYFQFQLINSTLVHYT
ncbi:unnamed protein product [Schistosoma margrebowiei]|uniref:Uncharacterized protein n=1 Tax=Schistosoma margrebowiei TaxID=48269 RepID=A0A183MYK0_9TREM|nr:unnamed protein product [Schistosoma margrebowiei]